MSTDPANSCALFITVHSRAGASKRPALSAKFQFEDHIRCVAARQCLHRNRENLRLAKMTRVAKLLHLPVPDSASDSRHVPAVVSVPVVSEPSAVGSFVQLSSPLADLSRSGLHKALQDTPPSDIASLQHIEMAQLQLQFTQPSSVVASNDTHAPVKVEDCGHKSASSHTVPM